MTGTMSRFGTAFLVLLLALAVVLILPGLMRALPGTISLGNHATTAHGSDAEQIRNAFAESTPQCYVCGKDMSKAYCFMFGLRPDLVGMMVLKFGFRIFADTGTWSEVTTYYTTPEKLDRYLLQDNCLPEGDLGISIWGGEW